MTLAMLQKKYPAAAAWAFGDSPQLADELAALVAEGIKTAIFTIGSDDIIQILPRINLRHSDFSCSKVNPFLAYTGSKIALQQTL